MIVAYYHCRAVQ